MKTEIQEANIPTIPKSAYYTTFLTFAYEEENQNTRKLQKYPYSCCGCYQGRGSCSHKGGLLMLIADIQLEHSIGGSQEIFEKIYPPSPLAFQKLPIPVEFIGLHDYWSLKQRGKRLREDDS